MLYAVVWRSGKMGLAVNPAKTKYVFFTRKCKISPLSTISDLRLQFGIKAKYLGLTFDCTIKGKKLGKKWVNIGHIYTVIVRLKLTPIVLKLSHPLTDKWRIWFKEFWPVPHLYWHGKGLCVWLTNFYDAFRIIWDQDRSMYYRSTIGILNDSRKKFLSRFGATTRNDLHIHWYGSKIGMCKQVYALQCLGLM